MKCIRAEFFSVVCVLRLVVAYSPGWVIDDSGCRTPDLGPGDCINQARCSFISDLLEKGDKIESILDDYACGIDGHGNLKVCCPRKHYFDASPANSHRKDHVIVDASKVNSETEDHSAHKNLHLLPKNCGDVRAWGIYTGNVSSLFEFGWPVLLKYHTNGDPYLCGGSLISKRYILTAARCIRNNLIGVVIGEHDVRTEEDCTEEYQKGHYIKICQNPPQNFVVSAGDAIIHPEYDSLKNDIALIRLRQDADTTPESVCPICLPITSKEKHHRDAKYTSIGWGATQNGLGSPALLKVLLPKIKHLKCDTIYRLQTEKMICAGGAKQWDACAGDEGGPLMGYYSDDDGLKTVQYGIVSIRPSVCDDKPVPVVFTKVASYVGWILDNLRP